MAGGAAQSVAARSGHPRLCRSRERLRRGTARTDEGPAKDVGRGDARPHQGRRFRRADTGRAVRLSLEVPRGRPAPADRPHAARRRRDADDPRRRCAGQGIRLFQVRRHAPLARSSARGLERRPARLGVFHPARPSLGHRRGPARPSRRDQRRRRLGTRLLVLLLRQSRREPPSAESLPAPARHDADRGCAGVRGRGRGLVHPHR